MRKAGAIASRAGLLFGPLALAVLAMRFLVPGRGEIGPSAWGGLARLGEEHPLALGVGLFLLLSAVAWTFDDRPPAQKTRLFPWLLTVVSAAAAALLLRTGVGQVYRVSSGSMLPTLEPADDLLVNKLGRHRARRGDVVVFPGRGVGEAEELIVKRVIGLPGDRIESAGGLVAINGWTVPYCDAGRFFFTSQGQVLLGRLVVEWLEDRVYLTVHTPQSTRFNGALVRPGELFVMGDNRNESRDSRAWSVGVAQSAVVGKAWRLVGWDRDGHLDLTRFLRTPGTEIHSPGIDARQLEGGVARCLKNRPTVTTPPTSS
jgi:signal peptidase I